MSPVAANLRAGQFSAGSLFQIFVKNAAVPRKPVTVFLKEHFADEITETDLPSVRVDHVSSLLGLIAVGGDAVQDTEALYDE